MSINLSLHPAVKKDPHAHKGSSGTEKTLHAPTHNSSQHVHDKNLEHRKPFSQVLHDQAQHSQNLERAKHGAKSESLHKLKVSQEELNAVGKKNPGGKKERDEINPLDSIAQTIHALLLPQKAEVVVSKGSDNDRKTEAVGDKAKTIGHLKEKDAKPADRVDWAAQLAQTQDAKVDSSKEFGGKKTASKSDDKKISVLDLRTHNKEKHHHDEASIANPVASASESNAGVKSKEFKPSDEFRVVFESVQGKSKESFASTSSNAPAAPRDTAALAQYLQDKGYAQLVDQARIILRNNNQGEIRMTLYPESLGKVKVALNLENSHLAGQIFVENQSVKDVFQQNMDQLTQSFRDGGFLNVNIQVSVGGENRSRDGRENSEVAAVAGNYGKNVSQVPAAASIEPTIQDNGDRIVNLTV